MSRDERLHEATHEVATTFFALTHGAVRGMDLADVLLHISQRAVEVLPVAACGILVRDPGGALRAVASSSVAAELLDLLQIQDAEGPCFECVATGVAVSADTADARARWPRFAVRLVAEGFAAVHAAPMVAGDRTLGAVNLFGAVRLGPGEEEIAQAFADLASLVLLQSDVLEDASGVARRLHHVVQARATLGQAIGILAERFDVDPDAALRRLQVTAHELGASVLAIARSLVARDGSHPAALDLAAEER